MATSTTRTTPRERRRIREQQILAATRRLFDERGVRDAQIEDVAREVGVNRAIIYRHFSGKEELFALTLVSYLDELRTALAASVDGVNGAGEQLEAMTAAFCDFGIAYPAFVDCAQTLMRRTGPELLEEISEAALFNLGREIAGCLALLSSIIEAGNASGEFAVEDPDLLANHMYASGLGALSLARVGMLIREAAPGVPTISRLSADEVKGYLVTTARSLARSSRPS